MKTTYTAADAAYLGRRRLRRHARVLHLWAMGVGAVISGDFFGWNFGLAAGGFGGMILAVLIMTAMYIGLCFSIAEMSPALPHAGGAYSFARTSMGPAAGYITGLAENMEYILTPAVIVVGIGGYLGAVFGTPREWEPLWWLLAYGVFVALNVWGVEMTFHVSVVVTLIALAVLIVFWVGAVPHFDLQRWAAPYFPRGPLQGVVRHRATSVRALAVSRDRATPARCGREPRPEARYAARDSAGTGHADCRLVPHGGTERRHGSRRGEDLQFQRAALSRFPDNFRTAD